ncbi:unnamed protein product [Microthlaspi erraticum]|uniref:Uncharacterized protein n=1 Tax=Microthlaspi erraticum TaxID=1685480 RepID=A0A6D2JC27_9BRAS|nr:unnamed protein product [Microthlaspi erraticum]
MARLRVRFRAVSGSSVLRLLEHYAGCLDAADFDWFLRSKKLKVKRWTLNLTSFERGISRRHRELHRLRGRDLPNWSQVFPHRALWYSLVLFSDHVAYMKSSVLNLGIIIASCGLLIVLYPDQSLISTFVDKVKVISQHFFVQLDVRWTLHPAKTWNGSFSWDDGL